MFTFSKSTYRCLCAAMVLLSGTSLANAAETCVSAPSCAELGYTLTSTANCAGTALKCPFDKTKYYCTQKNEVLNMMKPNWYGKSKLPFSSNKCSYTAPKDGFIYAAIGDITNVGAFITVNGNRSSTITGIQKQKGFVFLQLQKGDQIVIEASAVDGYFVPYAGN